MTFDEWQKLCGGGKVVDSRGQVWSVVGLITDPRVILQDKLGKRATHVISAPNSQEFKPDRRKNDRRRG